MIKLKALYLELQLSVNNTVQPGLVDESTTESGLLIGLEIEFLDSEDE